MRNRKAPETSPSNDQGFNPDEDRHPRLDKVMARITATLGATDVVIERLEIFANASGDASFRYWPPRSEEPEVGYLTVEELR